MEIFNIGPLELVFILLIALIVLGPEDMLKTGRSLAKGIRKFIRSPIWKSLVSTSNEIRELPRKFIREAGLEESMKEVSRMNLYPEGSQRIHPSETISQEGTGMQDVGKEADAVPSPGEEPENPEESSQDKPQV